MPQEMLLVPAFFHRVAAVEHLYSHPFEHGDELSVCKREFAIQIENLFVFFVV